MSTRFEVSPREDTRSPVPGRPGRPWRSMLYLAPAAVLVGGLLVVPLVLAVVTSFQDGLGNYSAVLRDGQIRHAIEHSLVWLVVAVGVCVIGLALAIVLRGVPRIGLLAAPVAVSALVAGMVFRLIFQPNGIVSTLTGGHAVFIGSGWIWAVLISAFGWQWVGLVIIVFRTGIIGIPRSLLRMSRSFGMGGRRRLTSVVIPTLLPVGALVLMIVLVAAARVFELILITAPGSVQSAADVVPLEWWRSHGSLGTGDSAALAVLPFLFVALAALLALRGLSREWPNSTEQPTPPPRPKVGRIAGVVMIALWAIPLMTLVITSFRSPRAAAGGGRWQGGFGLDSYRQAFQSGELGHALLTTGVRSLSAVLLVVVIAVPAAYALAWGGLSRRVTRPLIGLATVLAVVPSVTVIAGLDTIFGDLHLIGEPSALVLVHAAFGVPLAVLLLRAAFASVPHRIVRARQIDPEPGSALFTVVAWCVPAVITVAVLEFVLVWNDVVVGYLLGGLEGDQVTLVLLEQARQFTTSAGPLAAGAVVASLVPLGLVVATGRWLVRGLTAGVRR